MDAINAFNDAFAPYGLPATAIKPSYGIAEATLFVSTIAPSARATVVYLDRGRLAEGRGGARRGGRRERGRAGVVRSGRPQPVGRHRRLRRCRPNSPTGGSVRSGCTATTSPSGTGAARGSRQTFDATLRSRLQSGSHADGSPVDSEHGCAPAIWACTSTASCTSPADRRSDVIHVDGRHHSPQDIEATAAAASPIVRRGYLAVVLHAVAPDAAAWSSSRSARRARRRADPDAAAEAIRAAVVDVTGSRVADIRFVPAGAIPRTTSGKVARRACRAEYLSGDLRG